MSRAVKTIFITSFHPVISRNILSTGILDLLSKDNRIVILVPDFKKDYFISEFGTAGVFIEGVSTELSRADLFYRKLALMLAGTKAIYIKRRSQFYQDKRLVGFIGYLFFSKIFGGTKVLLKFTRFTDRIFFKTDFFEGLFYKYKPDLVYSTDLQNELDVRLLKEAQVKGARTVGMIRSWDNLTSKGVLRILPDKILVQNEIIKREAERYSLANPADIKVIGISHYDAYKNMRFADRNGFFKNFGFDPLKKLILFAPMGDRYIRNNLTDKLVVESLSSLDVNILVRLPPTDTVNFGGFKNGIAKIFFQRTGVDSAKGGIKLSEIGKKDDVALAEALSYSDLVITGHSTVSIDAVFLEKPTIAVYFDAEPRIYWDSIKRYYDYEYFEPILKSGGVKFANSAEDLLDKTKEYLDNPTLDKEKRQKIVKEQVGFTDGKSTQRLAEAILSLL